MIDAPYHRPPVDLPRRLVRSLVALIIIALAMLALIWAFNSGENSRCHHYQHQGGPQWAIDRYCGK